MVKQLVGEYDESGLFEVDVAFNKEVVAIALAQAVGVDLGEALLCIG